MRIQYQLGSVTVYQSDLYMTNSTVIETPDLLLVVDPNWLPLEVETIRQHVYGTLKDRPLYLLFTHSDYDHIIGYRAFPGARIIASRRLQERQDKENILEQIRQFDDDYYLIRDYPIEYPDVDVVIHEDKQSLEVGGTKLTFYLATGHTDDGIIAVCDPGGILLAGDYLSDVEFPYIYHSSTEYMKTLDKMKELIQSSDVHLLIPGHGNVSGHVTEINRRVQASENYINGMHRAIELDDKNAMESLIEGYSFPRSMRKFHEANRELISREIHRM